MFGQNVKFIAALTCSIFLVNAYADADSKEKKEIKLPITSSWDLTTNYVFRGLTQTDNIGAIQGGITYTVPVVGIYGNIWASNARFPDEFGNTAATLEFDASVGISNTIKENFTYNLSLVRYNYPRSASFDYNEVLVNLQYYFVTGMIGYTNDVYATGQKGTYYNLGINYTIPEKYILGLTGVNLLAGIGYYDLPSDTTVYTSYADYQVQLAKTIGDYQLSVTWTDTNDNYFGPRNAGGNKVIFTITANLS